MHCVGTVSIANRYNKYCSRPSRFCVQRELHSRSTFSLVEGTTLSKLNLYIPEQSTEKRINSLKAFISLLRSALQRKSALAK
jgi:hypothetical protein